MVKHRNPRRQPPAPVFGVNAETAQGCGGSGGLRDAVFSPSALMKKLEKTVWDAKNDERHRRNQPAQIFRRLQIARKIRPPPNPQCPHQEDKPRQQHEQAERDSLFRA